MPAEDHPVERHEATMRELDVRLGKAEGQIQTNTEWIFGPEGAPKRGAEWRVWHVEQEAIMRSDIDKVAEAAVRAYLRSMRGVLQTAAPYVLLLAGIVYAIVTGRPVPPIPAGSP